jgi:hypothetical protein
MAVRRPFAASRRASLSSEQGSLLVVMVGAIVLAIVTFAVLDGRSGAADTGERNRQRSVASTLAQQDIDRLRAFEITDVSNYRETRNVNMGGVSYTIVSRTAWVRDASGLISCTNDDTQAEYAQKFRGPVGTVNGTSIATGYRKDYEYNDRLRYREPPYFLDPVQASWRVARQNEQVPATAEPEE